MKSHLPLAILSVLGAAAAPAFSAGLDCSRAATGAETAICASENLRKLDFQLSAVYGKLAAAQGSKRAALRSEQVDWLTVRDRCAADTSCIAARYDERLATLRLQLRDVNAYRPDDVDRAALEELRQAVETARKTDSEFPLEKVIDALRIKSGITSFANAYDANAPGSVPQFPTIRPEGVTADEWRALRESGIEGGGENGAGAYTLMDVDGDGQRDLVIDTYLGGTGLFGETSVLRRKGGRFEGPAIPNDESGASALYTTGGRGANQSGQWIRLRGRVYAAYRNSLYGVDDVYLLRPLTIVGEVPKLTVRYRYRLSIPKVQSDEKGTATTLDDALHAALSQALGKIDTRQARDFGPADVPLCPVPEGTSEDDRGNYTRNGTGHYTFEVVGDVPVWLGRECRIGRVVDWFGAYSSKGGLGAAFWVRKPSEPDREQTYEVDGVRTATGTAAAIARFEVGN